MSAAAVSSAKEAFSGMRPVRYRRDLAQIADLIELCFAGTLDAGGRAALREMRLTSQMGPLLWMVGRLLRAIPEANGFVWEEAGRVVGNVTVVPAGYGDGYVIANVAVYPDFRRRGIARELMRAALALVERQGKFATLQVDAENEGARRLYESLSFATQRIFTRWRRPTLKPTLGTVNSTLPLRRLARRDVPSLVALAERVRPNTSGGMGWLRPTQARTLRPQRLGELAMLVGGTRTDCWALKDTGGALIAALRAERRLGGLTTVFDALVQPDAQGHLEDALVAETIQRLDGRIHPLLTDHPAGDSAMNEALTRHDFRPERTLVHMFRDVEPGS